MGKQILPPQQLQGGYEQKRKPWISIPDQDAQKKPSGLTGEQSKSKQAAIFNLFFQGKPSQPISFVKNFFPLTFSREKTSWRCVHQINDVWQTPTYNNTVSQLQRANPQFLIPPLSGMLCAQKTVKKHTSPWQTACQKKFACEKNQAARTFCNGLLILISCQQISTCWWPKTHWEIPCFSTKRKSD